MRNVETNVTNDKKQEHPNKKPDLKTILTSLSKEELINFNGRGTYDGPQGHLHGK